MVLSNLKDLKSKMVSDEKAVIVFRFEYKEIEYFIAVCLLTEEDRKKKEAEYALVRLCFMHGDDINRYLDCYANSKNITAGMSELRNFLGVEYQKDGIAWINGFLEYLGNCIPISIPTVQDTEEQDAILHTICRHENRNPNRIYRSHMFINGKENGKQKYRTEYNGQLASIRFPNLYHKFKSYKTISFAFTENALEEKTEEEVLRKFEINQKNKKSIIKIGDLW